MSDSASLGHRIAASAGGSSRPRARHLSCREKSAGEIARGLIEQEGETVRLIYALPTGEIPTEFKTKEKQLMFVLKKAE
jgi:hypothetical protein